MLPLTNHGDEAASTTEQRPRGFDPVSGKPIGEPVTWYRQIVIYTRVELRVAFREYGKGTFVKPR